MTMQSNSEFKPAERRSKRVNWIATICLIPVLLFALFLCLFGYREARAYRELNDKLNAIRQAGEPIDNASLETHFEKTTHKGGTVAWSEALMLARSANAISNGLPIVGVANLPRDFRPGVEWPEEPRVAEFLREIRPLFKKIDAAAAFPMPVWTPIDFNGFSTTLEVYQESRSLARILDLDTSYALFHKESERALKDIRNAEFFHGFFVGRHSDEMFGHIALVICLSKKPVLCRLRIGHSLLRGERLGGDDKQSCFRIQVPDSLSQVSTINIRDEVGANIFVVGP